MTELIIYFFLPMGLIQIHIVLCHTLQYIQRIIISCGCVGRLFPLSAMHLSQLSLVCAQMSRLISSEAVKWPYLQCKEPSAGGNKSKSPVPSEVASQFTPAVIFKRYSDGNFPLAFQSGAALTREDLRRATQRRARAGDGEKQQRTWLRSNIWEVGVWGESPGPFFQLSLWSLVYGSLAHRRSENLQQLTHN